MSYNTNIPIVTDGLVFAVDAFNTKSSISGSTNINSLIDTVTGETINGVVVDGSTWDFDGVNDYVDFGIPTFTANKSTGLSVDTWVMYNDTSVLSNIIITAEQYSNTQREGFFIGHQTTTGFVFQVKDVSGNRSDLRLNNFSGLTLGRWYNLVATIGGTFQQSDITMYVDGEEYVGPTSGNDDGFVGDITNPNLLVGARIITAGIDSLHDGRISKIKIYNRALTPTEILQNYNATKQRFI